MKKYKTIFFDLDHTLWDFELNSQETILELFHEHGLNRLGVPDAESFIAVYRQVNAHMWELYHNNKISKEFLRAGRFNLALQDFNIDDASLAEKLASNYLRICPEKKNLFPGTIETLEYLSSKYKLHIITNGFVEVQHVKIKNSGLTHFFEHIHISEEIGFKKPEPEIFNYAVQQSGTAHEFCMMVGDNADTDIRGAVNVGIDHILFNPESLDFPDFVTREVKAMKELKSLL